LADVVSGQRELTRCLYPVADSQLRVLPAGSRAPNALALLSSPQFRNLLRELRKQFDTIILDSPPAHLVSDALVLANEADGIALVVRSDRTQVRTIRQVMRRVNRTGARMLGVVVNAHDFKKADRYHGESSGYRKYGYERAYG
jgi:capsular exopolysaccharide synthesis family protein